MSFSTNKFVLNVLIRQNTRLKLSRIFEDKYPSFSQMVEEILINGIDIIEGSIYRYEKQLKNLLNRWLLDHTDITPQERQIVIKAADIIDKGI